MKKSDLFKWVIISSLLTLVVTACSVNPVSTTTTTIVPANTLAGLVYHTEDGLWVIDDNGQSRFLVDQPTGQLSPDGTRVAYEYQDDIWLADLTTGERQNLTQTPDRIERAPQWWPGRPNIIFFGSSTKQDEQGLGIGSPTIIDLQKNEYQVLDQEGLGDFALSPDGEKMAYSAFESTGKVYNWGLGSELFTPANFGVSVEKLYKPAWSPDGRYLAWCIGFLSNEYWQLGIAVFDLQTKTAHIIHQYPVIGGGSWPTFLTWSPDGQWLSFVAWNESDEIASLWVVRPDGSEELHLGIGVNPIWSPSSAMLIYDRRVKALEDGIWLYDMTTGQQYQILPTGTNVVNWNLTSP